MRLVLGICGYSGAGKTTLIERLLPLLSARGLRVAVLKHDAHRLEVDRPGKDTARFFDAGAVAVCAHDPSERFLRLREPRPGRLSDVLAALPRDLDLVLVEGHKGSPLPKIALAHPEDRPPLAGPDVIATLPWSEERPALGEAAVVSWLEGAWARRPLGIALFGLERTGVAAVDPVALARVLEPAAGPAVRVLLVGGAAAPAGRSCPPMLPAVPEADGPFGGLLALLRHDPERAWLCLDVGRHDLGSVAVRWLRGERRPGRWAVLPRLATGRVELLGAIYEPMLLPGLERALGRGERALATALADAPVAHREPPAGLGAGWCKASSD
jgi:molybdopterin-guanine dinucleotide biosynthesis protein MobB